MKLMIIEDNDKMRSYIKDLVTEYCDVIIESNNGNDAINIYDDKLPDLVFMDIELIGLDGLTSAEKIISNHPNAKIIFLTNYNDSFYQERANKLGAAGYLLKENMHELISLLKNFQSNK